MTPETVYLRDYQPPDYLCDEVELRLRLAEPITLVESRMRLRRNGRHNRPLRLDGEDLVLKSLQLNDATLSSTEFTIGTSCLVVPGVPNEFRLEITTEIRPQENTGLSGLYRSGDILCTQCEAHGFRRITYFLDRPDVVAKYTTTLLANRGRYPVLLSNGNVVDQGDLDDGRHWITWHDPYPKPSYLFAAVAGRLAVIEDEFVTRSGNRVALCIYTEHHNIEKCGHAMASLKNAMAWDEANYGREYDLDNYIIVAVDDFNMGAMENKGLNIFNTKYVLAKASTATDVDYENIESVIGHEYFHNWSGNRVTCRDWFQLSLKEGFTVFREQQFSAAMGSAGVKRIREVNALRTQQFREDAGPMAHPIRPASYQEINNLYTTTVYNKGAEVVRMLRCLLGPEGFRKGTDHYFAKYDGQAVTTDDFVAALEAANGEDLAQFRRWYTQAGTPVLDIEDYYDADSYTYELTVRQSCAPTRGQSHAAPLHIPLAIALLDRGGEHIPMRLAGPGGPALETMVLHIRHACQRFTFVDVLERPVPSLLRGFSAPVKLNIERDEKDLYFLMRKDTDAFSRWDAVQQAAISLLVDLVNRHAKGATRSVPEAFIDAFATNLRLRETDGQFLAELLRLPNEIYVSEFFDEIDPTSICTACQFLRKTLASNLTELFLATYHEHHKQRAQTRCAIGHRSVKNRVLAYLMELDDDSILELAKTQLETADNMTDAVAALRALSDNVNVARDAALAAFFAKWSTEPLVIDKWFTIQATARLPDTLQRVKKLTKHSMFNIKNPNRVYSLIGAFAHNNFSCFHDPSGNGYAFIADYVLQLDKLNPQVAARLVKAFDMWRRLEPRRAGLMRTMIEQVMAGTGLSRDVNEIVSKSIQESPA